ncbi:MAG: YdcF family protein [Clostridia bacterium]|nr:YdcF family protein [Clostridia bacterium]
MKKDAKDKQKTAKKRSVRKVLLRIVAIILACVLTAGIAVLAINLYVMLKTRDRIVRPDDPALTGDNSFDAVIVLGCSVLPDGSPSHMLADRVDAGVNVFNSANVQLIVLSGDRSEFYDEVTVMLNRALAEGVPADAAVEDPEGFSTYESMLRAAKTFGFKRVIVVSQKYHLYRALYIADKLGMDAYGVGADPRSYSNQFFREVREIAARVKDFFKCLF